MKLLAQATWADTGAQVQKAGKIVWGETSTPLLEVIGRVLNVGLGLLGIVFLAQALYAGFKWMTAQGDSKQVTEAKDSVKNNVIGLGVIVAAYALTSFVMTQLGVVTSG